MNCIYTSKQALIAVLKSIIILFEINIRSKEFDKYYSVKTPLIQLNITEAYHLILHNNFVEYKRVIFNLFTLLSFKIIVTFK